MRIKAYQKGDTITLDPVSGSNEVDVELEPGYAVFASQIGQRLIYGVSPYGMTLEQAEMWGAVKIPKAEEVKP
jgi:hypothetical protein